MKIARRNLLGRDLVVEILVTIDTALEVRVAMSSLDESAPIKTTVEALLAGGQRMVREAERLAGQRGLRLVAGPNGQILVTDAPKA